MPPIVSSNSCIYNKFVKVSHTYSCIIHLADKQRNWTYLCYCSQLSQSPVNCYYIVIYFPSLFLTKYYFVYWRVNACSTWTFQLFCTQFSQLNNIAWVGFLFWLLPYLKKSLISSSSWKRFILNFVHLNIVLQRRGQILQI